ncbi:Dolichyl-phosphate-mannose--protein mannosyltransferase 2 [Savitreella phatthalungensis]
MSSGSSATDLPAATRRRTRASEVNGFAAPVEVEVQKPPVPVKSSSRPVTKAWTTEDHLRWWALPLALTGLSLFTRLYLIGRSNIVTWDEAHFGKFASHYLKREFYFDVHPPLGKMLNGFAGWLAGYDGNFEFKSGEVYPESLNYTLMRVWNALFGAACVPLAYFTALELKMSLQATVLVALMVLCENSYATISRFILLDSMLLFFTFTTMFSLAKFHAYRDEPFSYRWAKWLALMGISIGCVCSVKWVGMFGTALCGLYTVHDLWNKFGETSMLKVTYAKHWVARIIALIVIPVLVYASFFWVHFEVLENSGPGDAQMPSLFQANLRGSELRGQPLDVAIGSRATIKNMGYGGGLLHSHVQTFPEGSQQQQVTCYHHKDANNDWFFYPSRDQPEYDQADAEAPIRFLADGDVVRLIHAQTGRNLHSHNIAAPVTKADYEVSCYGNLTIGDEKDHWQVEVVKDLRNRDKSRVRSLTSVLRFRHTAEGCYLRAANVNLPQWGFKQIEVTCDKKSTKDDTFSHWNVEGHWNERLPAADAKDFSSPFWRDFIHLNVAMMTSNNALVPDPDKADELASSAWQWPLAHVGLRMCGWDAHIVKYFLLGNPIVYWGSTASLLVFGALVLWHVLRWQRSAAVLTAAQVDHLIYAGCYPAIGWILHYMPFFIMGRVLYVHHYFPALWFAILTAGYLFDHVTDSLSKSAKNALFYAIAAAIIGTFINFLPFTFGMPDEAGYYSHLKWLPSWRVYTGEPLKRVAGQAASAAMSNVTSAVIETATQAASSVIETLTESA